MEKIDALRIISFGERIAEEERDTLTTYFVKTNQWKKLLDGKVDIIYGAKGSGKSALFMNLLNSKKDLEKENIYICNAENPRGTTVFSELRTDPPATEEEFVFLWKLYFLSLSTTEIYKNLKNKTMQYVYNLLQEYNLVLENKDLQSLLIKIKRYVAGLLHPDSIGTSLSLDGIQQTITDIEFKVYFREPSSL